MRTGAEKKKGPLSQQIKTPEITNSSTKEEKIPQKKRYPDESLGRKWRPMKQKWMKEQYEIERKEKKSGFLPCVKMNLWGASDGDEIGSWRRGFESGLVECCSTT